MWTLPKQLNLCHVHTLRASPSHDTSCHHTIRYMRSLSSYWGTISLKFYRVDFVLFWILYVWLCREDEWTHETVDYGGFCVKTATRSKRPQVWSKRPHVWSKRPKEHCDFVSNLCNTSQVLDWGNNIMSIVCDDWKATITRKKYTFVFMQDLPL